ncbi:MULTISPECIES: transcriptional regulator [Bacillati]|jgi:transcriptional antiterminator|uniref:transcriptional regulator n=2 Tax=Bacteria TaxID=2 RepID=UPI0030C4A8A1
MMGNKVKRTLHIYSKLLKNDYVNVQHLSRELNEHPRSIQRDLEDIRDFLNDYQQLLLYEHHNRNYYISDQTMHQNQEQETSVTYEMTPQLYHYLKHKYHTFVVKTERQKVLVKFQITPSEAVNFCFIYRKSLRLISPETLFSQFTTEFIKLQMNYMKGSL